MISIIVPVFNKQEYIENCIKSILTQSYNDIEIIIVNDGSTDNSLEKIKAVADKDSRIKIINKNNMGLSAARNSGMDYASGEFIMFVDADDELEENAIERLYNSISKNDVDCAVGSISVVYDAHEEFKDSDKWYYTNRNKGVKDINDSLISDIHCSASAKIFKKEIINKFKLRFPEGLCYEDAYWHWTYFSVCRKVYFIKEAVYKYFRRKKSIMSSTFELKEGLAIQHLQIVRKIFDFWIENNMFLYRKITALNILETYFWHSFKFSPNYEKANSVYLCAKIAIQYKLPIEKNETINKICNGDLGFLFVINEKNNNMISYARFLQIMSIVEYVIPKNTLRRKIIYSIARNCYILIKKIKFKAR